MNFDEWWGQSRSSIRPAKAEDAFRSVWDAAAAAEREACAKWLDIYDGAGLRRAEAIRNSDHIEK